MEVEEHDKGSESDEDEKKPSSEYEKMLEENRAKNEEFLKSLRIDEIKQNAEIVINGMKKKKEYKKRSVPIIQRASKRKKEHVDYSQNISRGFPNLPTEKSFEKSLKFKTQYGKFVEEFNEIIEAGDRKLTPVLYDKDILQKLSQEASTMRIQNISAMSWFPSTDNLILAVGDSSGSLNLTNFEESEFNFYTFPVHSNRISHLQCNPYNRSQLISSGFDGKVLCGDIQSQMFSEVLKLSEGYCTNFDFISSYYYIMSLSSGQVIIADSRKRHEDPPYRRITETCHSNLIHSINVHPGKKNYFVTVAGNDPYIYVWDLRQLGIPVVKKSNNEKKLVSAAFSPVSGNFLLSKSPDQMCIFDCTTITEEHMKCYSTFKCADENLKGHTRPVWLPNSDHTFACSFTNSPAIHVFDKDFNTCERVARDVSKKLFIFHPFKSALACVTSANKLSVYT